MNKLSEKFRYIVIVAFLGSAALSGLTLFSFEKFNKVFGSYRDYDVVIRSLHQFQSLVVQQNYLVAHYIDSPQNKMIRSLEENNQKIKKKLQEIRALAKNKNLQNPIKNIEETFEQNTKGLENVFISEAEKAGRLKDVHDLYYQLLQHLSYLDQITPTSKVMRTLHYIMTAVDQGNLIAIKNHDSIDFDLTYLLSAPDLYAKSKAPLQDKAIAKLSPLIKEFVLQIKELRDLERKSQKITKEFDQVYATRIFMSLQRAIEKTEIKQKEVYETWLSKNALARHSLEFVALFTIVSLCWLMVGMSQFFSLRR